eukprot:3934113-Prymnesium_polylepis.1
MRIRDCLRRACHCSHPSRTRDCCTWGHKARCRPCSEGTRPSGSRGSARSTLWGSSPASKTRERRSQHSRIPACRDPGSRQCGQRRHHKCLVQHPLLPRCKPLCIRPAPRVAATVVPAAVAVAAAVTAAEKRCRHASTPRRPTHPVGRGRLLRLCSCSQSPGTTVGARQ